MKCCWQDFSTAKSPPVLAGFQDVCGRLPPVLALLFSLNDESKKGDYSRL